MKHVYSLHISSMWDMESDQWLFEDLDDAKLSVVTLALLQTYTLWKDEAPKDIRFVPPRLPIADNLDGIMWEGEHVFHTPALPHDMQRIRAWIQQVPVTPKPKGPTTNLSTGDLMAKSLHVYDDAGRQLNGEDWAAIIDDERWTLTTPPTETTLP